MTDNLRAGVLFGYSENKADFGGGTGGFKLSETMMTAYAGFNPTSWYLGGSLGAADLKFKNVRRNIELGSTTRTEQRSSKGNHIVARLNGGMNLGNATFTHGPTASLTYQQIKVNGFAEDGAASTTMYFTEQTRKSLTSSIGYLVSAQLGGGGVQLQSWARVAWENEHNNDDREVRASLVTMGGSFALPTCKVDLGVSAQFRKSLLGFINYNLIFSEDSQTNQAVMVGLRLAM